MKVGVIVNPHAKRNRARRDRVAEVQQILGDSALVVATMSVEDIGFQLERFMAAGVEYIVADGGDGTLHCVLNQAIARLGVDAALRFSYLPSSSGTINYMARLVGLKGSSEDNLRRLRALLTRGLKPELVRFPSLLNTGRVIDSAGRTSVWGCHSWSNAVGGYAANFHQRWYDSHEFEGAPRIVALFSEGLAAAALNSALRGPLAGLRPQWLEDLVQVYGPLLKGEILVDDEPFVAPDGSRLSEYSMVNVGAIPVNLAGVFRVFGQASERSIQVHVGQITPSELPAAAWKTFKNKGFGSDKFYDGPAQSLEVRCAPGETLRPALDGEVYHDLVEFRSEQGPLVSFVRV